jgi:tetratricopeptide (TPR) repeat protein
MSRTGWLVVLVLAGSVFAQYEPSDRMHEFEQIIQALDTSSSSVAKNAKSILSGSDDDPTLAADVDTHEPVPAARKLAVRAEHLSGKGQHEQAIALYRRALLADPKYYEAANALGLEYFAAGHGNEAIATLRRLTETNPKQVLAYDNLAILLFRLKRLREAEAAATHAYDMHPFSYRAAFVYGAVMVTEGKWTADAKQSLRYASARHPEAKELLAKWPASAGAGSRAIGKTHENFRCWRRRVARTGIPQCGPKRSVCFLRQRGAGTDAGTRQSLEVGS